MLPVGLQLYSIRDEMEQDFGGTLKKVKEMGYDGVEFAGLFDHSVEEVKAMLKEADLIPVSAHVPFVDMIADPEGTMKTYSEIGCKYIVIPYQPEEYRYGAPQYDEFIEKTRMLGETACKYGMTLLYHNHDWEFKDVDGKFAMDIMYDSIPSEYLQTEIDTCWAKVAGTDPADYVRKYTDRSPVVHLKDYYLEGHVSHMYGLIGLDDEETANEDEGFFEYRPLSKGMQDVPSLLKASEDAHAQWVVVEQDEPSKGMSRMECVKTSIDYLRSL